MDSETPSSILGNTSIRLRYPTAASYLWTNSRFPFPQGGRNPGEPRRTVTLPNTESIRRYLMYVRPSGFQKIRYSGCVNNRRKSKNLKLIFTLQGHQRFRARYTTLPDNWAYRINFSGLHRKVCGAFTLICPIHILS